MSLHDSDCLVLCRYLDGALPPEELDQLKEKLQGNPSLRKNLAELVYQRQWLMEMKDESHAAKILETVSPKIIERKSKRLTAWLALAASLTLALGVWIWMMPGSQQGGIANALEVRGEVLLGMNGKRINQGQEITEGAEIITGNDGWIKLAYGKGIADIALEKNSKLLTTKSASENSLRLEFGQLTAKVAKQLKDKPFIVTTPHAAAKVMGTELNLVVSGEATKLSVLEGEVVFTRLADNAVVNVAGGQHATISPNVELVVQNEVKKSNLSNTILLQEFEVMSPGQGTPNQLISLHESGQEISVAVSEPIQTKSSAWQPTAYIRLEGGGNLFQVPTGMEVRLRIKSEQEGECTICLEPGIYNSKEEAFNTKPIPITPEWETITVHAAELIPYRRPERGIHTPDLDPGVRVSSIAIFGFGTGKIFIDRLEVLSSASAEK